MDFDYIVIGSGSAGCPLTARLLEKGMKVLLVEAGKRERLPITRLPAALIHTVGNSRYDWCYKTEPDPTRGGLIEAWPRGKVPGGSSAINGMIFIRGAKHDYDAWEALGNTGWGWQDVLPYFRRMETADADKDNGVRGGMGPQRVSALRWKHPVSETFMKSFVAAGATFNDDMNGISHEGVAWNQGSTENGVRASAFDSFVRPKLNDPNLRFIDDTLVEKVIIQDGRAIGIQALQSGKSATFKARRGVVLSAGSINSPQLLMLSGVGDPEELKRHGITPLVSSPEVGKNLLEHPGLYALAEMKVPTANRMARPLRGALAFGEWLLGRRGVMSVPTAQIIAFIKSTPDLEHTDLQFHLFPFGLAQTKTKLEVPKQDLVTILMNINHSKSVGHLELRSGNPRDKVAIYPRMLEHPDDVETLLRGIGWIRKIVSQPPFSQDMLRFLDLPDEGSSRDEEIAYLRRATVPFYHPVGTCRMGSDATAVVTPDLKIRGVEGLWVADASIMPRHISGNTNATAIMIGEKASDLVHP
ncbi:GMC family oxidoreductase N-terminal domain-containing protein [Neorhizobium sp. T786]|uniref:GMC family oxidoreductase n=1 Tax=Pseudorhizobium xiangyangii TaxID=2883104 RepID=UPI001CFFA347|nr:GMC family oxidoreductase N-terminal domain-containing protein [Neorhizobium xiangyangii]MCB5205145.1 GMC family oxidoreductase N-terminal domain-containing protein [Neorhizobium xiangyangii]